MGEVRGGEGESCWLQVTIQGEGEVSGGGGGGPWGDTGAWGAGGRQAVHVIHTCGGGQGGGRGHLHGKGTTDIGKLFRGVGCNKDKRPLGTHRSNLLIGTKESNRRR